MQDTIISKSNEKVKFIKGLNEKKNRIKNHCYYLEGIKVVLEVIKEVKAIDIISIAYSDCILEGVKDGIKSLNFIKKFCFNNNIKITNFSKDVFSYMTDTITPQGILAVVKLPKYTQEDIDSIITKEKNNNNNILILDKIQDLGNLGTIVRSCDAFNLRAIFCIEGTADIYSPKAVRSTMASILRVNVIYIKEEFDFIQKLKKSGYIIASTTLTDNSCNLNDLEFLNTYAFIMGNEANGVDENLKIISDMNIKIPMSNSVESLNVSIATGIILYEQFKIKNKLIKNIN